ncbi:uncharacterized protein LOC127726035 isoform X1 [Mytilus californianus]|uniref:uncharacterized protein LOC127726035 isoform X1 n=2 Tax=Mytilus californianus TaxID=6549 RepID=UPI0022463FF2|nr:uncharacterized protein LOC127726035 isoform X1 [Mytilus californianus]
MDEITRLVTSDHGANDTVTLYPYQNTTEIILSSNETTVHVDPTDMSEKNEMWFQVSIALFVVVGVFLIMFIFCFIRQRRILRKALSRTLNRHISGRTSLSHKYSINSGFEASDDKVTIAKTEDVTAQSQENVITRRNDSNCESGFESFPGSIMDRRRDNVYESGIGSMEGSIKEYKGKIEEEYTTVSERHAIFHTRHRRISEEDSYKEESEIQRTTQSLDFKDVLKNIEAYAAGISTITNDAEKNADSFIEDDYENVLDVTEKEAKTIIIDTEEISARNLENPTYGIIEEYDREISDTVEAIESDDSEVEENACAGSNHHMYQNYGHLRKDYLSELKCNSAANSLNFLNLNWDYKCDIDINGGLVKAPNSDISLCLPANFISTPATTIFWSIFAQDYEVKSKTNLESCIVSPVVEYYTPYKEKFDEYVVIELPHCISEHEDAMVQPYWFHPNAQPTEGKINVHQIPHVNEDDLHSNALPEVFFIKTRPGFVTIYTIHFSVYFCACSQNFPLELYAVTFGKYVPIDHNQVNIKIKVHIADAKITLKDCLEALKQDEQVLGYSYKGKTEIDVADDIAGSDSIEIKVDFEDVPRNMNPIWKHSVDKEGFPIHPASKSWNLSNRFKCGHHKFIQTTKEWQFKNESPPRFRTVFQCFIEILYKKYIEESIKQKALEESDTDEGATSDYEAMEHIDLEKAKRLSSHRTVPKSENGISHTSHQCVSIRTRMTVDIDLSDTVIENHYPESIDELQCLPSRRGILPSIIYEIVDGLEDDKFNEMCRRLGADRELRSLMRSSDNMTRGKKYDLLDGIRDDMSDGKFCREILTVLMIMKENKLRQAISEHIQKATHTGERSVASIEPQTANFQRLIPVQNEDRETLHQSLNYNDETFKKVVE